MVMAMLGQRLVRHDDGLPDAHVVVLELRLAPRRALGLPRPHCAGAAEERDDARQRDHESTFHLPAPPARPGRGNAVGGRMPFKRM